MNLFHWMTSHNVLLVFSAENMEAMKISSPLIFSAELLIRATKMQTNFDDANKKPSKLFRINLLLSWGLFLL